MARVLSIDVGRKNLALCALTAGECPRGSQDGIRHWTVTACEPTAAGIAKALRALPWALDSDEVVIERQPNRNPTMTRLQHYLEMYFVMHDKPVTVQDAKHKLAFAAGTPWWPTEGPDNWSYHTRKKLSVQTTRAFLEATPQSQEFKDLFAGTTKKDDLGDSLLQGMAFCHNVLPLELTRRGCAASGGAVVKPRKPTPKQAASGRYSKPNIAYLLKGCRTPEAVAAQLAKDKALARSVDRQFGGVEAAVQALRLVA